MRRLILAVALTLAACGSPRAESKAAETPVAETPATLVEVAAPADDEETAMAEAALAMVRAIYALPDQATGAQIPAFFAEDLAAALTADAARADGPRVESDYRYGGEAPPYRDLTVESEGTNVRVEFKSDGTPHSYLWAFCSREDGQVRVEDLLFDDNALTSVLEVEGGGAC